MPRCEPPDWNETALYCDIIFDGDIVPEASFLRAAQQEYGPTRGRGMLEPVCGSGRLVAAKAWRGCAVSGFDLSVHMLDSPGDRVKKR